MPIDYNKELNREQYEVVTKADGPCLVLAGAGSGKTRTIVYRVAYLIEKGVNPGNILLLTFTNKAAKEMLQRVALLLKGQAIKGLWGGTFHHIANLILRKYATLIGYQPNFTILDEEDSICLIKICLKELKIDTKTRRYPTPSVIKSLISYAKNSASNFVDVVEIKHPRWLEIIDDIKKIAKLYEQRKKNHGLMDFDDLLTNLLILLKTKNKVTEALGQKFQYILVDEYQDTNKIQAEIIRELAWAHKNILVVGDDAQSIYSFRAAEIKNILDFPKIFAKTKIFHLETNYRSTPEILGLANDIIEKNSHQYPKNLKSIKKTYLKPTLVALSSSEQEAEFIREIILQLRDEGTPLEKIAVLFRATHHSQALEFELTRSDIPYDYRGGLRFFERAHIKDIIAFLKVIANVRDEISWRRLLNMQLGIGEATSQKIVISLIKAADIKAALREAEQTILNEKAAQGFFELKKIFTAALKTEKLLPKELIKEIIKSAYRNYLELNYQNFQERLDDLEQLAIFAERYENLNSFLAEITMQENFAAARIRPEQTSEGREERVILSTIHQAKGLEWEAVFIINLIDGGLPNPRALNENGGREEERRLFYVAVTRAQKKLYLTYPLTSNLNSLYLNSPSEFIGEISQDLYEEWQRGPSDYQKLSGEGIEYLPDISQL